MTKAPPRAGAAETLADRYPLDALVACVVRHVEPYAVFVQLPDDPAVSGVIRRQDWSWSRRVMDLPHATRGGERLVARVVGHGADGLRLSRRAARPDPYPEFRRTHRPGDTVVARVQFVAHKDAGVVVSLGEGIDGFVPRSHLPPGRSDEEGFGLLAEDEVAAHILRFEEREVVLSVRDHLLARDRQLEERRRGDWSALRFHPELGVTLENLYWNLQLEGMEGPRLSEELRRTVRRVLILEDNLNVSESLVLLFDQLGLATARAESVEEAQAALAAGPCDLLILDVNMPESKGIALLESLPAPPPRVFVLTASEQQWQDLLAGRDTVRPTFFRKPVEIARVLARLGENPGEGGEPAAPPAAGVPAGGAAALVDSLRHGERAAPLARIEQALRDLATATGADQGFVLCFQPGPVFRLIAGSFPPLTRKVQQELEISIIGDVIRERSCLVVPDVERRPGAFKHLLAVLPAGSFAGIGLAYRDQADYGLFLAAREAGRFAALAEERLRMAALEVSHHLAEHRFDQVVTQKQGLLLTGFLADSLLHEVKNELQALDDFAAVPLLVLKERGGQRLDLAAEEAARLRRAVVGIQSVSRELRDLVALFRNLAGPGRREVVDVNRAIGRLLKILAPFAEEHDTLLATDLAATLPAVEIDPKLLDQSLLNVMINGVEQMALAGSRRRRLAVRSAHLPGAPFPIRVAVADTGPGIHAVHREKIFDLFFSTKERGTGLGLYLARYLVGQLGGRLRLGQSLLFAGSEIVLELPAEVLA